MFWLHTMALYSRLRSRSGIKCTKYRYSTINRVAVQNAIVIITPQKACRSEPICKVCATSYTGNCSSDTPCSINCKGKHAADDKKCPEYIQEMKLQKFKSDWHLTLREARRQFIVPPSQSKPLYATVTAEAPTDFVTKASFEDALQKISEQFTSIVQTIFTEIKQYVQATMEVVTKPLMALIQDIQSKKNTENTFLQNVLVQKNKRSKLDDSHDETDLSRMDIEISMDLAGLPASLSRTLLS